MNFERENSSWELNNFDRQLSQQDFYSQSDNLDYKNKEIDSSIFSKNSKGNKLQLIEKLEICKTQEDEESDTNIVNGFDDSLNQDNFNSKYETQSNKYEPFTSWERKKSRNFKGLNQKIKPNGIKTMMNMKENISHNSSKNYK